MHEPSPELLSRLVEWLRIPSISTGGGRGDDLARAAQWACDRVVEAGGGAAVVPTAGHPLVVGELPAAHAGAPTVLAYGHYDVQDAGDPAAWTSPPFEPTIRSGRLYARGAADDKGNFLPLLHVACALARAGKLPVNVRVLVEGEEESGGSGALEWLAADIRGADCAIVFDSGMADPRTPALTLGLRGMVSVAVRVRTATRDLHSGLYGGSVLNAAHALHALLAAVLPGPDGRLRHELRAGVAAPSAAELQAWSRLPAGSEAIAEVGGRPAYPDAGARFYEQTGADASLDVNAVAVGQPRTIVPAEATAMVSLRIAPGQDGEELAGALEGLLRAAAPPGADVDLRMTIAHPALFAPNEPAIALAALALERACEVAPIFTRSGGSIPIVAGFAARGIPTIVSGFATAEDAFHAPDESYRLESLALGERAAHELYAALVGLATRD